MIKPLFEDLQGKCKRLCKARAEAKFTWIMPSRRQFSCKRAQSSLLELPSAAENVKKRCIIMNISAQCAAGSKNMGYTYINI